MEVVAGINPTPTFAGTGVAHGQNLVDAATIAGTEVVEVTLPVNVPQGRTKIVLIGDVYVTGAVGTTTVTVRVRRDSLTGAIVGEAVVNQVVGAVAAVTPIVAEDDRGPGPFTWVLTATIAGAAATFNGATLDAIVE